MHTVYIIAARYARTSGTYRNPGSTELQFEPRLDEDAYAFPDTAQMTGIQGFSTKTGDPITGQLILDANGLRALRDACTERLHELGAEVRDGGQ